MREGTKGIVNAKVSVLMPCYNTPDAWLWTAIKGIARQTYPDLDLIIADDGSTASTTIETLKEAEETWPDRVRVVRHHENRGTAYALDMALQAADSETDYFSAAASDDIFHPRWQQDRIAIFEKLPSQVGILYENYMMLAYHRFDVQSWSYIPDIRGQPIPYPSLIPIILRPYDYRLFLESNFIPGVAMWRADVYDKVPKSFVYDGYETEGMRHAEDYAFWLRITDHYDAFWHDCDPAFTWTYRFTVTSKYNRDRRGVNKARNYVQRKARERRGV